ncbi:MAG TPA: UDP-N-acetylmuramoyl-tripeptide--D-alanyl-D-alanine ligase [Smithella sp.]|nr:UDP-N-acetylmuramoyl-tripeptide--D-alanyl-D-alanine ligase [Smithella sp.]HNY49573.1 UDP-N-acetylmuramoyl-tripeptide--D-alanyl-D-alanine ligase [Smithella sp.]HOG89346.1 UDP-N-acetylmuramoyl-tripeptide--D-alanyl-D-alanine ligase [Smithella sp.]HOU50120.1 UDP-N-acetylmuramoyl-tripeptide--D-alanyl-D-alanine ligase [Smithella sp.]HQG64702.1 UDP-N-acetylmuramoyl-tripeptide--D-alanyl-D-alanine ligase [Smithella sp.]
MIKKSPVFSVTEVLQATSGTFISGTVETIFQGISTDSRLIQKGNLFVALKGEKFDGHDFIETAIKEGVSGLLIQDEGKVPRGKATKKVAVIKVADTLFSLGELAHYWRKKFSIPVIGLTGSSGKTTTKEMIAAVTDGVKKTLKTEGNLNNLIGLPQTILRLTDEDELAILEMGTNTRGEIRRLTQIANPDIGLITNIGPAHLAGFGSMAVVRDEKSDLFFNMSPSGTAVINLDDALITESAEQWKGKKITFSMSPNADVTVKDIEKNGARGMRFNLIIGDQTQKTEIKIVGLHHVHNAMAAAATAFAAGVDIRTISEGLGSFRPFSGRMEIIKLRNGAFLIDDSYNANPASVREALMSLKDLKSNHNAYVFLGDMLELGDQSEEMHRKIGMLMATIGVHALFLKGDFAGVTAAGAREGGLSPDNIFFLLEQDSGVGYLKERLKKGDWILVKGSRGMKMEKIVSQICDHFGSDKIGENSRITD